MRRERKFFHRWKMCIRGMVDSIPQLDQSMKETNRAEYRRFPRSRHTPLNTVRVVILGQDPYHNFNQAHGLCFSVRPPTKAPPSLKNIYKALSKDYPSFKPPPNGLGLLTPWADRVRLGTFMARPSCRSYVVKTRLCKISRAPRG